MVLEDYLEQMEYTDFSVDVTNMHHNGFVMENDDKNQNRVDIFKDGSMYN